MVADQIILPSSDQVWSGAFSEAVRDIARPLTVWAKEKEGGARAESPPPSEKEPGPEGKEAA